MSVPLRLFVYGTLKRGWWNHARYCLGHLACTEALALGRLYQLPAGYPMLEVPEEAVLAEGTASARADVATQDRLDRVLALHPELAGSPGPDWMPIPGEVLTFDDPAVRLRAIDRLEGFTPGQGGLYRRVLLPVVPADAAAPVAAWAYVAPGGGGGDLARLARHLPAGRWPVAESGRLPGGDPLK